MILLDTNVISAAMKPEPHPAVPAWLNDQASETLYLSSVTSSIHGPGNGRRTGKSSAHQKLPD